MVRKQLCWAVVGGRPPECEVLHNDKSRLRAQNLQPVCEMDKTTGLTSDSFWTHAQKCPGAGPTTRENPTAFICFSSTREGQGMTVPQ